MALAIAAGVIIRHSPHDGMFDNGMFDNAMFDNDRFWRF
jgi:hypothetical protein